MRGRKKSWQKVAPHAGKRARNAPLERGANAAAVGGVKEKMQGEAFFACIRRIGVLLLWCQICLAWAR